MSQPHANTQKPTLVADIGGTSARLALARGGVLLGDTLRTYARSAFPGPLEAVRQFEIDVGQSLAGCVACLAIATPIDRQAIARDPRSEITFTNSPWAIVPATLQSAVKLRRLIIINDFEAQAYALPALSIEQITSIGGVVGARPDVDAQARWPLLVVGPGTGLGASLWLSRARRAICTEGGQISFAPTDAVEIDILARIRGNASHVPVERLLSGDGLELLHQCLHDGEKLDAAQISSAALAGDSPKCIETIERFCAILGSTVGDLTLATGARGGVYLAGGILPRVASLLLSSPFRERFVAKGQFRSYLDAVPTWLVEASAWPHRSRCGCRAVLMTMVNSTRNHLGAAWT